MACGDRAVGQGDVLTVEIAKKLLGDPVCCKFGIAPCGNGLVKGRTPGVGRQHAGIVARQVVVGLEPRSFLVGQLGQVCPDGLHKGVVEDEGEKIGIGKVPVIMGILLRPHRPGFTLVRIEQTGLLGHCTARLDEVDLAPRFVFDGLLDEPERVHVLDLAPCSQMAEIPGFPEGLIGAGPANRDVDVSAKIALLHVAVTRAKGNHDGLQLLHIGRRFERCADVGLGNNFHQGDTGPIEIDIGGLWIHIMD